MDHHATLVLLSGGMDSTALLAHVLAEHGAVEAVGVNYGQRHARELDAAAAVATHYGVRFDVVDLTGVTGFLASALTDHDAPLPEGHYADESMKATVVPGRNAIMLSVAAGIAASRGMDAVATAVHAGDHPIYPDCRPEFIAAIHDALLLATGVGVRAPFVHKTKTEIARIGHDLGAPLGLTWSCYAGGDAHCGRCGTCVERIEAYRDSGVPDPTTYEVNA